MTEGPVKPRTFWGIPEMYHPFLEMAVPFTPEEKIQRLENVIESYRKLVASYVKYIEIDDEIISLLREQVTESEGVKALLLLKESCGGGYVQ
jgi:hypothetical protein